MYSLIHNPEVFIGIIVPLVMINVRQPDLVSNISFHPRLQGNQLLTAFEAAGFQLVTMFHPKRPPVK